MTIQPKEPMDSFKGIFAVAERGQDGQLTEAAFETLAAARQVAGLTQEPVTAVVFAGEGEAVDNLSSQLAQYGADSVLILQHALLAHYQVEAYTNALSEAIGAKKPSVVLMQATATSRDFLPRVAIKTFAAYLPDAVQLALAGNGQLEITRPAYAENMFAKVTAPTVRPQIVTTRSKAFRKLAADSGRTASSETHSPALDASMIHTELVSVEQGKAAAGKSLDDADIIVSGGRGVKGPENFNVVEELAQALGAAVGASRAVVDAGWRPHSEQVGQTGKTVSPNVYIALGIHGAIQHQVGMSSSNHIIAVNTNPDAPIFEIADFGIVGDLFEVAPLLTKAIKEQNLSPV